MTVEGSPESRRSSFLRTHRHVSTAVCGTILTVFTALCLVWQPSILEFVNLKVYDSLLRSTLYSPSSDAPVIVDIDESSLARYGQWPWPRYRVARLLQALDDLGPRSVGIDISFVEPDRTSLSKIREEMLRDTGAIIDFAGVPEELADNDALLARVLSKGPFVLAYSFLFDDPPRQTGGLHLHPARVITFREEGVPDGETFLLKATSALPNIEPLASAAPSSGFFNVRPDADGVLRRLPLLMEYEGRIYGSLSLATLIEGFSPGDLTLKVSRQGTEELVIDGKSVPLGPKGTLLVKYGPGARSFTHLSAADVMEGTVDPSLVKNRIALVGASAMGIRDTWPTPVHPVYPGVEVHATVIDNILSGSFLSRPHWALSAELILTILAGLATTIVLTRSGALPGILLTAGGALLLWVGARWSFSHDLWLSPLYPLAALIVNFSLLSALKFRLEERKVREHSRGMDHVQEGIIEVMKTSNVALDEKSLSGAIEIRERARSLNDALRLVEDYQRNVADSLAYASLIQRSLLPSEEEVRSFLPESFFLWEPRDVISGDVFFASPVADGFIVALADCTGHGVPGALLTMIAVSGLRKITVIEECREPAEILKKLNRTVKATLQQDTGRALSNDGMAVSICVVRRKESKLLFAGAGLSLVCVEGGASRVVRGDRQSIGYRKSKRSDIDFSFTTHEIPLETGLSFYMYTDGLPDQLGGEKGLPFGNRRVLSFLNEAASLPFEQQKTDLLQRFEEYSERSDRRDDVTVLGFSVTP